MKVISYLATLPAKSITSGKNNKKVETLLKYAQGVNGVGDQGIVKHDMSWEPSDVAVILGWVHEYGKQAPHLSFRQEIVDRQKSIDGRVVIADSNLFLYKDTSNPEYFLRYSFDGVFPNTGEYCDANPNPLRWKTISASLDLFLKPWRNTGNHILLCLQRNGGWSMGGINTVTWAQDTIQTIRKFSSRPIVVRGHPGDKKNQQQVQNIMIHCKKFNVQNVSTSLSESLIGDLSNCWAMVNHNSSPAIAAAIEGIPVFCTDPTRSQAAEISNTDFSKLESPAMPDRQSWIERISQFHWSHNELVSGQCWKHMKQWIKK